MHGRNRDLFRRFLSLLHSPFRSSLAHLASVSRHRQVSMYALDARYTDFSWKLVRQWAECASPNAKLGSGLASTVRRSTHTQQKPHLSYISVAPDSSAPQNDPPKMVCRWRSAPPSASPMRTATSLFTATQCL